jgi:uncharacterized membrane protein (DUF485 family)
VSRRLAAIGMAALLLIYLVFIVQYAFVLIGVGEPIAIAMGVALLVLPLVGAWALVVEFVFVVRADRLLAELEREGGLPDEALPLLPSGRPDRAAADERFPVYKEAVETEPESWQAWLRLSLAYNASGDSKRARWATREAIRLARAQKTA